jgi:hypothetical protein
MKVFLADDCGMAKASIDHIPGKTDIMAGRAETRMPMN